MTAAAAPLLELRGVHRRFGDTIALDDASLTVRPGRVHALLGENGAGKTTLMRIAFGLVRADAGEVRIGGTAVVLREPGDAITHGVGMVHQHFTLVPGMTVAENVALGGRGLFDRAAVAAAIRELGEASGLRVDPAAPAAALSVAAQQRVEILKALYRNARVLILDEPTAVLAPAEADELMRWLREYVARGNAAVLITHKLGEASSVADDVTVLRRGRVTLAQPTSQLTVPVITSAMLGDGEIVRETPHRSVHRAPGAVVVAAADVSAGKGSERIRGATFAVHAGEIVGVAGVEGAGHHTLLRLLARRVRATSGSLQLPQRTGFVPEDRHRDALILEYSVAENVALNGAAARHGRARWAALRARARDVVRSFDVRGLPARADAAAVPVRALSGGNQQKLVLGRELAAGPDLLVVENPTRGLDVRAAAAVREQLREAADRGTAVVMYSADLDEVLDIADWVLAVHAGHVQRCSVDREQVGRAILGIS